MSVEFEIVILKIYITPKYIILSVILFSYFQVRSIYKRCCHPASARQLQFILCSASVWAGVLRYKDNGVFMYFILI